MNTEALKSFLDNKCFIFHSDYGKKGVELKKAQRLKNQNSEINCSEIGFIEGIQKRAKIMIHRYAIIIVNFIVIFS